MSDENLESLGYHSHCFVSGIVSRFDIPHYTRDTNRRFAPELEPAPPFHR